MAESPLSDRSRASFNINDLSDDLLEEIFRRLQCLSAVRCMSVSKDWYTLISSPNFICGFVRHHHRLSQVLKQQLQHNSYVLFSHEKSLLNPKVPTSEAEPIVRKFLLGLLKDYRVLVESNGWLCCTKHLGTENVYYTCNPLTNYWLQLPDAPSTSKVISLGFLCDPYYHINEETEAVTVNSKCRFAVVRLATINFDFRIKRVEIFSSSTGRWSESSLSCLEWFPFKYRKAVAFNGKLHFLGHKRILKFDPFEKLETCIASKCHFIDLPEGVIAVDLLITSSGSLGILQIRNRVKIWELNNKEQTWSLQEKENLEKIVVNFKPVDPSLPTHDIFSLLSSIAAIHSRIVFCHYDNNLASYKLHGEALIRAGIGTPWVGYCLWMNVPLMVLPWWSDPALDYPRMPSS